MARKIDTTAVINSIRLAQQSSNPASPAASYWLAFIKSDGLYLKDSAGNVMGPIRGMANSTLWDAKGDLAVGTGADAGSRLAVGADNTVLTAASGEATGVKWAAVAAGGGRTLISEQTPTGTGTCTFSSIATTYTHLRLEYIIKSSQNADEVNFYCYFNNDTTATNYRRMQLFAYGANTTAGSGADDAMIGRCPGSSVAVTGWAGIGYIDILYYLKTTWNHSAIAWTKHRPEATSVMVWGQAMDWESTTAINRVDIVLSAGNFAAGSTLGLYGLA